MLIRGVSTSHVPGRGGPTRTKGGPRRASGANTASLCRARKRGRPDGGAGTAPSQPAGLSLHQDGTPGNPLHPTAPAHTARAGLAPGAEADGEAAESPPSRGGHRATPVCGPAMLCPNPRPIPARTLGPAGTSPLRCGRARSPEGRREEDAGRRPRRRFARSGKGAAGDFRSVLRGTASGASKMAARADPRASNHFRFRRGRPAAGGAVPSAERTYQRTHALWRRRSCVLRLRAQAASLRRLLPPGDGCSAPPPRDRRANGGGL